MNAARGESVTLQVADGTKMNAWAANPAGDANGILPGLLVFQEAFGVNAHIRDITERFAAAGYIAIAPELFHRTAPGLDADYKDFPAVMPHMQALTEAGLTHDVQAAFDWLQKNPRVAPNSTASIGFCLGGRVSFLANSVLPLKAAVSFYGGGIAPSLLPHAPKQHGSILFFWGGLDAHIPQEQIQSVMNGLKEAKKTYVNVEFSDANHGFFCDARSAYNEAAAKEAWALASSFLTTNIKK